MELTTSCCREWIETNLFSPGASLALKQYDWGPNPKLRGTGFSGKLNSVQHHCQALPLLAHLSQRLIGELIVCPCSGVRRRRWRRRLCCPPFSNIFSFETAWPIKAKFYVEPPWEGGTKVYINGPGHMTKMAAMPIYGKNVKKSSSPEPEVL